MYGDSYGSPGQDDHFDPSSPLGGGHPLSGHPLGDQTFAQQPYAAQQEPFEPQTGDVYGGAPAPASFDAEPGPFDAKANPFEPAPEFDSGVPATDVKVAGAHTGTWSRTEMDEVDAYQPERSARNGTLVKVAVAATAAVVVIGGGGAAALAMSGGSGSGKKAAAAPAPQASLQNAGPDVAQLQNQVDENARKVILDRASQAARSDAGKAPALSAKGATPTPTSSTSTSSNVPGASSPVTANAAQAVAVALMPGWGWDPKTQFNNCLKPMWNNESGWNVTASNGSGAYGIPQALPGDKMSSAGSDWRTSAATQIKWGFGYIRDRYGSPCQAWAFWQAHSWY